MKKLFVVLLALLVCFAMPLLAQDKEKKEMAAGDMDGRRVWHRIGDAIDELRRTAPGTAGSVH